jgi:hypothetical protein
MQYVVEYSDHCRPKLISLMIPHGVTVVNRVIEMAAAKEAAQQTHRFSWNIPMTKREMADSSNQEQMAVVPEWRG